MQEKSFMARSFATFISADRTEWLTQELIEMTTRLTTQQRYYSAYFIPPLYHALSQMPQERPGQINHEINLN